MEISIFLAKFWGWLLVIIGLVFLFRRKVLEDCLDLTGDKVFALIGGYISLIVGLVTVILNNIWLADWRIIVTILGWMSLLKGITLIAFPGVIKRIASFYKGKKTRIKISLVIAFLLGIWLLWVS